MMLSRASKLAKSGLRGSAADLGTRSSSSVANSTRRSSTPSAVSATGSLQQRAATFVAGEGYAEDRFQRMRRGSFPSSARWAGAAAVAGLATPKALKDSSEDYTISNKGQLVMQEST